MWRFVLFILQLLFCHGLVIIYLPREIDLLAHKQAPEIRDHTHRASGLANPRQGQTPQ